MEYTSYLIFNGKLQEQKFITPFRTIECATLGRHFRDIIDTQGHLFAIQVPMPIAEAFVESPNIYSNVWMQIEMMRTSIMKQMDTCLFKNDLEREAEIRKVLER